MLPFLKVIPVIKSNRMKGFLKIISLILLFVSCEKELKRPSVLKVSSGKVERLEHFNSAYVSPRHVDIWLPENYDNNKKYAVLYMHDGQMLFDTSITWNHQEWGVDEVIGDLIKEKKIEPCIIVGIWNAGSQRYSDYFPQEPFNQFPKNFVDSLAEEARLKKETSLLAMTVKSDDYLKFLTLELKPYIDKNYATKRNRQYTFIAGSSMGGLISMYAICEYPQIFGGAACLSTHWPGIFTAKNNPIPNAFINYLDQHLPDPKTHRFYFDYGTASLDTLYEPFQLQVDTIMQKNGYSSTNWKTFKAEGADHSEKSWRKRLHLPITFLLEQTN